MLSYPYQNKEEDINLYVFQYRITYINILEDIIAFLIIYLFFSIYHHFIFL